jgi:hypothetical protein
MSSTRTAGLRISAHATARWTERVDRSASPLEARLALAQLASMGRTRSTPRHWTDVRPAPGLTFIYWSGRPSVCALAVDGVVVTVLTRELCAATAPRTAAALRAIGADGARRPRSLVTAAPATWRWDGRRDAA